MPKTPVPIENLTEGEWYIDPETDQEYRLLKIVDEAVVEIIDRAGNRRTVNRMLWVRDMREIPKKKGKR